MQSEKQKENQKPKRLNRRTLLKTMGASLVLGAVGVEYFHNRSVSEGKARIIEELGLQNIHAPSVMKKPSVSKGDLLRVGIIGFGSRARDLAKGLGFIDSETTTDFTKDEKDNWLAQEDLNVSLTGICEVFDLRAEQGLSAARNKILPGGRTGNSLPVKRYFHFQEMLDDKDIDAVIIATPDHHHSPMSIAAAKAGKHVYCEKCVAHSEEELFELYDTVKNCNIVYQLGHQITQNVIFQQAKEIVKKDVLGKITLIETTTNRNTAEGAWIRHLDKNGKPKPGDEKSIDWKQWLGSRPYKPFSTDRYYNWTKWFDYDIGMLGQLFTHEYDAVNQLLRIGIPKSAVCTGGIYYWKDNREIPDVLNAVFEYPNHELTLIYSASLATGRNRGRVFMGHDASMELGGSINITADPDSTRYKKMIEDGLISTSGSMISINPNSGKVDAVTSATSKYYASMGLTTTNIDGKQVDVTHLHIREWINCIRNGGTPSANIERAFEEGVTCLMAHKSYVEKRRVEWDPVNQKIV